MWSRVRKYLLLVLLMLFIIPTAAMAAGADEISPDHWAYKTMQNLISKGYLSSYQGGVLGSGKPVTRMEFALAVDKLLKEIEGGKVQALREDLDGVRKLINEFRNEMVDAQDKMKALDEKIANLEKQRVVLNEDFARMTAGMRALQKELDGLKIELAKTKTELAAANSEVSVLKKDLSDANDSIKASKEMEQRLQKSQRRTNVFLGLAFILALVKK